MGRRMQSTPTRRRDPRTNIEVKPRMAKHRTENQGPPERPLALLPQHVRLIEASAISPEVAEARGYWSVTTQAELKRLGFGQSQLLVPTLVIPIYGANGEVALYHHRPDQPRMRDGKPAKYEFPPRSRMAVDVHPMIRGKIGDPKVPLFITEGVRKADSAISLGLICITLVGTWNWRGTNEVGGKTALPDWEYIALKDQRDHPRETYIVFDSDCMRKPQVHQALARLSEFLKQRGARVHFVYLPHGEDGRKVGLDDYLAAGHKVGDLLGLATERLREPPDVKPDRVEEYELTPNGIYWNKPTSAGTIAVRLTNFRATITGEVVLDDGVETKTLLEVEASLRERRSVFTIPAGPFSSMSWPLEHLGAGAIVSPGLGVKDHARAAIQMLSGDVPVRREYAHLGWRRLEDGSWAYLHSQGAIAVEGMRPVAVRVNEALRHFALPVPPVDQELYDAIRATFRIWDLAEERLTVPVFAATHRSALGPSDFGVHIAGPTGALKTAVAALYQQHFGPKMDGRHLPANWSSTENSLEALAFEAKDALLVIDDFAPHGSSVQVQQLHAKADRVLRAQGNRSARQRMRPDASLRPPRPPRGLILSTGEDVPSGQSLRARMMIVEIARGAVDKRRLSACQEDARRGLYAKAMSGYLQWLAGRYDAVREGLDDRAIALRDNMRLQASHLRTPDVVANLALGLRTYLDFAMDVKAISAREAEDLWERGLSALVSAGESQEAQQAATEPVRRFIELVCAALASGQAHVAGLDGGPPVEPEAWGWRERPSASGGGESGAWREQGDRIGWVEGADLYVQPDAAYRCAKRMGDADGIVVGPRTLRRRLREAGLLLSTEPGRDTTTIRKTIEGQRREVLHLSTAALLSDGSDQTDRSDPSRPSGPGAGQVHFPPSGQFGQFREDIGDAHVGHCEEVEEEVVRP
jgi:hypothetical protein